MKRVIKSAMQKMCKIHTFYFSKQILKFVMKFW